MVKYICDKIGCSCDAFKPEFIDLPHDLCEYHLFEALKRYMKTDGGEIVSKLLSEK